MPADFILKLIDQPEDMTQVEELQALVWSSLGNTEVIPAHMLLAAVHNGGVLIGAYAGSGEEFMDSEDEPGSSGPQTSNLLGIVFGFPGFYHTPDGPRLKHYSHLLGVNPAVRNQGIGFALKRAQWQVVRHQGIDLINWTYDPLLSRNARLNIAHLGAVCSTYRRNEYGELRDSLNTGLPTDRFQVDWWVNSQRVRHRMSRQARRPLHLTHYLEANIPILSEAVIQEDGWPRPGQPSFPLDNLAQAGDMLLLEIPADFQDLRRAKPGLAYEWRMHGRLVFEALFEQGYLVTDFIHQPAPQNEPPGPASHRARSFYVLSFGEAQL